MKILIDANVLYPTVMREMVLRTAGTGLFQPLWSPRILEEWARVAARLGPAGEAQARREIAELRIKWPESEVLVPPDLETRLWLPDPSDRHVLAAAIQGAADALMTMNAKDFPRHILAEEGMNRIDPDAFLFQCWQNWPDLIEGVGADVLAKARKLSGENWRMRALMKKARMPRLGRALG